MGTNSGIEYVHHSWGPWRGCQPVSEGCKNCYAQLAMKRYGHEPHVVTRAADATFQAPLSPKWKAGERVFGCPWSDFFHHQADHWRPEAWQIIKQRMDLSFLIVTKHPDYIPSRLPESWGRGWPNVWLIATTENQHWFNYRMCALRRVLAAVRGISFEPALEPIEMGKFAQHVDWVVAGCESGPNRRRAETQWFRDLRDQCVERGIPFYLKQMEVDGKVVKMPKLDGKIWDQLPTPRVLT